MSERRDFAVGVGGGFDAASHDIPRGEDVMLWLVCWAALIAGVFAVGYAAPLVLRWLKRLF